MHIGNVPAQDGNLAVREMHRVQRVFNGRRCRYLRALKIVRQRFERQQRARHRIAGSGTPT